MTGGRAFHILVAQGWKEYNPLFVQVQGMTKKLNWRKKRGKISG